MQASLLPFQAWINYVINFKICTLIKHILVYFLVKIQWFIFIYCLLFLSALAIILLNLFKHQSFLVFVLFQSKMTSVKFIQWYILNQSIKSSYSPDRVNHIFEKVYIQLILCINYNFPWKHLFKVSGKAICIRFKFTSITWNMNLYKNFDGSVWINMY